MNYRVYPPGALLCVYISSMTTSNPIWPFSNSDASKTQFKWHTPLNSDLIFIIESWPRGRDVAAALFNKPDSLQEELRCCSFKMSKALGKCERVSLQSCSWTCSTHEHGSSVPETRRPFSSPPVSLPFLHVQCVRSCDRANVFAAAVQVAKCDLWRKLSGCPEVHSAK